MRRPTLVVLALLLLLGAALLFHRGAREEKPTRPPRPAEVVDAPMPEPEPAPAAPEPPKPRPTPPPGRPRAPAAKAEDSAAPPLERTGLGVLRGTVRYAGKPPLRKPLPIAASPECAALHAGVVLNDELVVHPKGGVRWAFVYVKSGINGQPPPPPAAPVLLDQIGCVFAPHVLGIRVGQPLLIKNSDPLLHNVHGLTFSNMEFNVGVVQGTEATQKFTKREIMLQVRCDIHPWMRAWIGVVDHPYFAVTGDEGGYAIAGLPAGRYVVEVWHEKFAPVSRRIEIDDGEDYPLDFTLDGRKQ